MRTPLTLVCLIGCFATAQDPPRPQSFPGVADFRGLSAVSETVAWVGGTKGTIGRTADGGRTWRTVSIPDSETLDFRDIEAFGDRTAYALSIGLGESSRIYKTVDAGKSWTLQFRNPEPDAFYDALAFWDETHGLALSDPVNGRYRILTTSDGGSHWTVQPDDGMPAALPDEGAFAASGTCLIARGKSDAWFVTGGARVARVFHSPDRGKTWTARETPIPAGTASAGAFSIAFRDSNRGVIVGGDYKRPDVVGPTAAVTADGGKTWKSVVLPFRSGVVWAGERWLAVGPSGTHVSVDGETWRELDRENGNAVCGTASGTGWVVGPKGRIATFTK